MSLHNSIEHLYSRDHFWMLLREPGRFVCRGSFLVNSQRFHPRHRALEPSRPGTATPLDGRQTGLAGGGRNVGIERGTRWMGISMENPMFGWFRKSRFLSKNGKSYFRNVWKIHQKSYFRQSYVFGGFRGENIHFWMDDYSDFGRKPPKIGLLENGLIPAKWPFYRERWWFTSGFSEVVYFWTNPPWRWWILVYSTKQTNGCSQDGGTPKPVGNLYGFLQRVGWRNFFSSLEQVPIWCLCVTLVLNQSLNQWWLVAVTAWLVVSNVCVCVCVSECVSELFDHVWNHAHPRTMYYD